MTEPDKRLIPPGRYCYLGLALYEKEGDSTRYLRKRCPFFKVEDYGVVRCTFLEAETSEPFGSLIPGDDDCRAAAIAHYGSEEAAFEANQSFLLYDGCKECGENEHPYEVEDEKEERVVIEAARDQYVRQFGYTDHAELETILSGVSLSTEDQKNRYYDWVDNDFTKEGLLRLVMACRSFPVAP